MFMMINRKLVTVVKTLGLTNKHAVVYVALLKKDKTTPLTLARDTGLNRSSIYRYLEDLRQIGLVEEIIEANTTSYQATEINNLELVVKKQETKLEVLRESVPILIKELSNYGAKKTAETQIKYFQGREGLKQFLWNVVHARRGSEFLGYGYLSWNESVGRKYAENLRQVVVERNLSDRELTNDIGETMKGKKWTEIPDYYSRYQERFISKKTLEIKHDCYLYDDVVGYYYFINNELFGLEIHNAEIAKTQKQIFEILWKLAE